MSALSESCCFRVFQALKSEKETGEVKVDDIVNDDPITQKEAVTMETEKTTEAEKTTSSCETVMTTVPVGDITIRDVTASGVTDINVTVSDVKMDTTNAVNKSASDTDILAVRKSVTMETLDVTMTTKRDIIEELDSGEIYCCVFRLS